MPVRITYLGHSGFILEHGKHALAVDPFLTDNPLAKHKPADVKVQHIALTHGHSDHYGDTETIAKRNDATVIAAWELADFAASRGVKKVEAGNPGGRIHTEFGWVAFTQAIHSSSMEGRYLGNPCGLIIHMGGVTFYHCGDTDLFSDMRMIGEIYLPDVAMLPIGDRYTMGPELASRAAELIMPKVAIPVHYNTWPPIAQDPRKFAPKGVEVKVMQPGDAWSYGTIV